MEVQELNNISNDLAVVRLSLDALKIKKEEIIASIPEIATIEDSIAAEEATKKELTDKLLSAMREEKLKQWKTEQATYSRATRESVGILPGIESELKKRMKNGEAIPYLELRSTEYMSIRVN